MLVACLAGIAAALVVGLVNVFFVVYFDNDPFIVTLGTMTIVQGVIYIVSGNNSVGIVSTNLSNWIFTNDFLSIPLEFYYGLAIFLVVWYVLSFTPIGQKALVIGQSREVARLSGVRVNRQRAWAFIIGAAIAGIAGIAYAGTNGTVDPTAGSALILPAYAAVFLGATAIKPGRINALGAFVAVYFLATGTVGLELLGAQSYFQQIFYGAALVVAITIPKVNRERFFREGGPLDGRTSRTCSPSAIRSRWSLGERRPRLRVRLDPRGLRRDRGRRGLERRAAGEGTARPASHGRVVGYPLDVTDAPAVRACVDSIVAEYKGNRHRLRQRGHRARPPAAAARGLAGRHGDDRLQRAHRRQPARRGLHRAGGGRHMKRQRSGSIITTASTAGLRNDPYTPYSYAIAKAAVVNFTKQAAHDLARWNVRVNAIAPGPFKTHLGGKEPDAAGGRRHVERGGTARPDGRPAEIRGLALLLASPAGSFMTGGVYPIDGGALLQGPSLPSTG